jgi:hypothetical protein
MGHTNLGTSWIWVIWRQASWMLPVLTKPHSAFADVIDGSIARWDAYLHVAYQVRNGARTPSITMTAGIIPSD